MTFLSKNSYLRIFANPGPEMLYLSKNSGPDRAQWQRTTILSGHPSHYVSACTWDWTHVLWVPRQVCYPLGHSGK